MRVAWILQQKDQMVHMREYPLSESNPRKNISKVDNSLDHETAHSKIRSNKVPASVPDEFVWHDCWYDAARRLYVYSKSVFCTGSRSS